MIAAKRARSPSATGSRRTFSRSTMAKPSRSISKGDHAAAKTRMEAMERSLPSTRRRDWAYFHHLRSVLEQRLGQFGAALDDAERALALARETGLPAAADPALPAARRARSRCGRGSTGRRMRRARGSDRTRVGDRAPDVRATARGPADRPGYDRAGDTAARGRAPRRRPRRLSRAGTTSCSCAIVRIVAARLADFALEHGIETGIRARADRAQCARRAVPTPGPHGRFGCAFACSADSSSFATVRRCASPAKRSSGRSIC